MNNIYIIILGLCMSATMQSQDLKADLTATQNFLQSELNYRVKIEAFHKINEADAPEQLSSSTIKKMDNLFRYEMSDFVSIVFPNQFLVISESSKEMIYQQMQMPKPDMGMKLEFLYKQIEKVDYHGIINGHKKYVIEMISPLYDRAIVWSNPDTGMLENVQYFYADQEESEAIYLEQRLQILPGTPLPAEFNMEQYITATTDGIVLNKKYQDYDLLY